MMATTTLAPTAPVLEPDAKRLAEDTDPHPRIYEMALDQARALFDQLQSGAGVAKPEIDEEWVEVDAGKWGTVRARMDGARLPDARQPARHQRHQPRPPPGRGRTQVRTARSTSRQ